MTRPTAARPGLWIDLNRVSARASRLKELEREPSAVERQRERLHQAIREAHQVGHSYRAIAQAAGISHQRVSQILAKEEK